MLFPLDVWAYGVCAVVLLFLVYVEVERRLCQHDGCELHEICPVCGRRNERKD